MTRFIAELAINTAPIWVKSTILVGFAAGTIATAPVWVPVLAVVVINSSGRES